PPPHRERPSRQPGKSAGHGPRLRGSPARRHVPPRGAPPQPELDASRVGRPPAPAHRHGGGVNSEVAAEIVPGRPVFDRRPPWSREAEQSVLAGMLQDRDAVARAVEILDATMFYQEAHRLVFRGLARLFERGEAIDPILLADELEKTGDT